MKRFSDRISADFKAKLISNNTRYVGVVNNFSEEGICVTADQNDKKSFSFPGATLEVELPLSSGEVINLLCKVIWSKKAVTNNLGLEILEKPFEYESFFKSLYHNNMQVF
jgi:hypothetical protein